MASAVWTITATIQDNKGKQGRTQVYLPNSLSVSVVAEYAQVWANTIKDCVHGKVVAISLSRDIEDDGSESTYADFLQSDVEEGAVFTFETLSGYKYSPRLPSFREGNILPNTRLVDLLDATVSAYIDVIVGGTLVQGVNVIASDNRGVTLEATRPVQGVESFRRYRP